MIATRVQEPVDCNLSFFGLVKNRSIGPKPKLGLGDDIALKLYSSFHQYQTEPVHSENACGGIFNLEFNQTGRLLAAACEKRQVLLLDASNQKLLYTIQEAHSNCVNCIRFFDETRFATCSDDTSIKLWDVRMLKFASKTLYGHSNWVKNIEFVDGENIMVTSDFDGGIYAWDMDKPADKNVTHEKIFLLHGLMRTKLSPDGSKMIISTTNGYMIIIHDLCIPSLAKDLRSFRPNLYRLMQMTDQNFPVGNLFNRMFNPQRKRNRVEFVDDFPNDAELISSLQIHPHGWCAVSRSLNGNETEEWTSVHDIQERLASDYTDVIDDVEEEIPQEPDEPEQRPPDLWMGYRDFEDRIFSYTLHSQRIPATMEFINSGLIGKLPYLYSKQNPEQRSQLIRNLPRLTHFAKEKISGKGYIKELCLSSDGRIIVSPYDKGIRLLSFNNRCQELSDCVPDRPKQLSTMIEMNDYHSGVVVSCKFNPRHMQIVSGCLNSQIKWYQPKL